MSTIWERWRYDHGDDTPKGREHRSPLESLPNFRTEGRYRFARREAAEITAVEGYPGVFHVSEDGVLKHVINRSTINLITGMEPETLAHSGWFVEWVDG